MSAQAKKNLIHAEFQTDANNIHLIRQDRETTSAHPVLVIQGFKMPVLNFNAFGVGAEMVPGLDLSPNQEMQGEFFQRGEKISQLELRVARLTRQDGKDTAGFAIIGEPLDTLKIRASDAAAATIQEIGDNAFKSVPPKFFARVLEVKYILERIEEKINQTAQNMSFLSHRELMQFEDNYSDIMGKHFSIELEPVFADLAESLKSVHADVVKISMEFFRYSLSHIIYQSPFSKRSLEKPLGYAGDFEMMNLLYRDESLGQTLFAKCLHRYYMNHPNARAVRNRKTYLSAKISEIIKTRGIEKDIKILSVACGPAEELTELFKVGKPLPFNPAKLHIHLLDQDVEALKRAQSNVKQIRVRHQTDLHVEYLNTAIKNIIAKGLNQKYDLIYSAGLFDYFSNPVAIAAAKRLYDALEPGGKLVLGNFDYHSPHKALMDLALDWHLIYRSAEELTGLYENTGGEVWIESEPESINLFANISKPRS